MITPVEFLFNRNYPMLPISRSPALFIVLVLSLCIACDSDETNLVQLHIDNGGKGFTAIVTVDDKSPKHFSCPADSDFDDSTRCIEDGIELTAPKDRLMVVIKSRGFEFSANSYKIDNIPIQGGLRRIDETLSPIASFEQNERFTSGFEPEDGLDHFKSMAVSTNTDLGKSWSLKFYIDDFRHAPKIYFQNTKDYPLHHMFARHVLGDTRSASDFEAQTYKGNDRLSAAGLLVFYETIQKAGDNIQSSIESPLLLNFATYDDISPELIIKVHQLLEARLGFVSLSSNKRRLTYTPAGEERTDECEDARLLFEQHDAPILRYEQLYGTQEIYVLNEGIAYGTLKRMTPEELEDNVVSFSDILMLTRVPSTLPGVGGTITEERQTPLSHVNIAARTRGTPNMTYVNAKHDERLMSLVGKLVRFEIKDGDFSIEETTAEEAEAYLKQVEKERLIPEFDISYKDFIDFENAVFDDAVRIGAKAANLGELKQILDEQAPNGFGIPFYFYDTFMGNTTVTSSMCADARIDCIEEGRSTDICKRSENICRDHVDTTTISISDYVEALLKKTAFNTDTLIREALLDGIRYIIRNSEVNVEFAELLNKKILDRFGTAKVRLRSSTNAEDLMAFSGAGLYESVSAYGFGDEKPAEKQIRKVWASVWNWRAFEERRYWNVDHSAVKMGIAVNQSFPNEAANGVLITHNLINPMEGGLYVNVQQGETSVTNPENGATPEIFAIVPGSNGTEIVRLAYSSLSPSEPILTDQEIRQLSRAANTVSRHFSEFYNTIPLDLEFKFHGPKRDLFIKQARPFVQSTSRGTQ